MSPLRGKARRPALATIAITAVLALGGGACGTAPTDPVLWFSAPSDLAERLPGVPPQENVIVLDTAFSRALAVGSGARVHWEQALTPPPGDWVLGALRGLRTEATAVTLIHPAAGGGLFRARLDLANQHMSAWEARSADALLVWDGALRERFGALVTGPVTAPAETRPLPPDLGTLPAWLSDDGFPYLTTDAALAWWDPISATTTWRQALTGPGDRLDFAGGVAAWTEAGRIVTAAVDRSGSGPTAWAPLEAAVVRLRIEPGPPWLLWLGTADGALHRVGPGNTPGILCFADRDATGSQLQDLVFRDRGALSNPRLEAVRLGREGCPGWLRNDSWTVQYEVVPAPWASLRIGPETALADLPHSEWIRPGDRFLADRTYTVEATAPLRLAPPLDEARTGRLLPVGRWEARTVRAGFVGLLGPDLPLVTPGLELRVLAGADPADPGDYFTFRLTNGVTPFAVATVPTAWDRIAGGEILVLDRKGLTVSAFDPAGQQQTGTLR